MWCMVNEESVTKTWFGERPDISHLRIYRCKAYMHVLNENRKSLYDRAEECILVGYGTATTYRLMTKKTRRIVVTRDVKFHEASLGLRDVQNNYAPRTWTSLRLSHQLPSFAPE